MQIANFKMQIGKTREKSCGAQVETCGPSGNLLSCPRTEGPAGPLIAKCKLQISKCKLGKRGKNPAGHRLKPVVHQEIFCRVPEPKTLRGRSLQNANCKFQNANWENEGKILRGTG